MVYCFAYNNGRHANMQPPSPPNIEEFALKECKQTRKVINRSRARVVTVLTLRREIMRRQRNQGKNKEVALFFFLFNRLDSSGWVPKYDSCFPICNVVACRG